MSYHLKIDNRKKIALVVARELRTIFPDAKIALNFSNSWELLVAVILSAQCTDKKVNEVTEKLFKKYKKLEDYVAASQLEFQQDIFQTGFYHNKAKNILATAKIIKEKHNGKIPCTMEELIQLPGVARKTANVVLGVACGVFVGIPVDTHVRRLSNLLGLSPEKNPDKTERDLMQIFPKPEWPKISYRMIEYGRKYCPAKAHDHSKCPLTRALNNQ
ncbi:MAG: Endonuclease III [Candidatus Moranbacteria bacterium GW2011_GWE1_36_7]|nr:MAG: Endonuclease III [Candidatus Moranbacteria bacterium GW2011_GWD2_36_12]KKQ06993.1 MAG: Endonuclease III [Candidatus Moranbacteria bacterium GW2011_GWE2_36_40]KKQ15617.1 MAG: Endonuclease III [Candidatus Moranbacteria bacterium GW2011_GWE1_36_7]